MAGISGAVLLAAAWGIFSGWLNWPEIGRWLRTYGLATALSGAGLTLLSMAAAELRHPSRRRTRQKAPLSWWAIAGGAALVIATTWGAIAWLLHEAAAAQDPVPARVDAVKTGIGIGAGTGGLLALLVAVRRQWHQEVTALDTTHDATERRVTDLYTKAVEQLGSDKAPVRLGGLYALERLAQDNPTQRQTIVNVFCAYLRMPYTPPDGKPPKPDAEEKVLEDYRERVQERQVRLTAQRLLGDHLRTGVDTDNPLTTYWADIDLDLTGATLIDFSLGGLCAMRTATFTSATFHGFANFESATFTDHATFHSATFNGLARFSSVKFNELAVFILATFNGEANFESATFYRYASFPLTRFVNHANFQSARFKGRADFRETIFAGRIPEEVKPFWSDSPDVDTSDASTGTHPG
jgi:hypothetical protein